MIYKLIEIVLKTKKPSTWLKLLAFFGLLPSELSRLSGVPQSPKHHPEGDALIHTFMAVDEAARWVHEVPKEWRRAYMWGLLYHDVGKYIKTDYETLSSIDHEKAGAHIAEYFLINHFWSKGSSGNALQEDYYKIVKIVENHMSPLLLTKQGSKRRAWFRLHRKIPLNVVAYVALADRDGRGNEKQGKDAEYFKVCMSYFELCKN